MQRSIFDVTLTIASPFLFPGLASGAAGVDVACLRDEAGHALLPGDQLRGVLKAALHDLAAATGGKVVSFVDIEEWFGLESKSVAAGTRMNEPLRGKLIFSDLTASATASTETVRIAIDDELGAVKRGSLQVIELAAPFRQPVSFKGSIIAFHEDGKAAHLANALSKALRMTPAIGGIKSPGFGEIIHCHGKSSIQPGATTSMDLPAPKPKSPGRIDYRITFDRPLLVDSRQIAASVFEGAAMIPGAVIKGALARRLVLADQDPEKGPYAVSLAQLSVGPALPENGDEMTGRALPLSLIAVKNKTNGRIIFGDALGGKICQGAMLVGQVPAFQTDWKDGYDDAARKVIGLPCPGNPALLPRTHTAIKENIANTGQIFTAIARSHLRKGGLRHWRLTVDYSGVQKQVHAALFDRLLADGLDFIGKTSAHATFRDATPGNIPRIAAAAGTGGKRFAVVLETAAVLHDAAIVASPEDAYSAYWKQHGAILVNFYASQRLAGGYLATRYGAYGKAYYPFVLTNAGSVFLLEGEGLQKKLEGLALTGLPVPDLNRQSARWETCPYVPQNGYGRFSADYLSDADLSEKLAAEVIHV